jgi:hypothetical protein
MILTDWLHDIFVNLSIVPFYFVKLVIVIMMIYCLLKFINITDCQINKMFDIFIYTCIIILLISFFYFPVMIKIFIYFIIYFIAPWIIPSKYFPFFMFPRNKIHMSNYKCDTYVGYDYDDIEIYGMNIYTWKLFLLEFFYIAMTFIV